MHAYIRTYIYTYVHTHTYIHTYIHTYVHTYTHKYIHTYIHTYVRMYVHAYIYKVSQEERTKLRESVPYVKLYRYNPKHLYPKLNGYGDNGREKCGHLVFPRSVRLQLSAH